MSSLQMFFVILKLCGVVKWQWQLVLIPTLITVSSIILLFFIVAVAISCYKLKKED